MYGHSCFRGPEVPRHGARVVVGRLAVGHWGGADPEDVERPCMQKSCHSDSGHFADRLGSILHKLDWRARRGAERAQARFFNTGSLSAAWEDHRAYAERSNCMECCNSVIESVRCNIAEPNWPVKGAYKPWFGSQIASAAFCVAMISSRSSSV